MLPESNLPIPSRIVREFANYYLNSLRRFSLPTALSHEILDNAWDPRSTSNDKIRQTTRPRLADHAYYFCASDPIGDAEYGAIVRISEVFEAKVHPGI